MSIGSQMLEPHKERRVLVVDDNDDVRTSLRLLLELDGHIVREAKDGPIAIKVLLTGEFEIAFLDLELPGIDGFEVARQIRRTDAGRCISLVAVSGYATDRHHDNAIDAGFDEFMPKPADPNILATLVNDPPRIVSSPADIERGSQPELKHP